jgi:hypothetical protein
LKKKSLSGNPNTKSKKPPRNLILSAEGGFFFTYLEIQKSNIKIEEVVHLRRTRNDKVSTEHLDF